MIKADQPTYEISVRGIEALLCIQLDAILQSENPNDSLTLIPDQKNPNVLVAKVTGREEAALFVLNVLSQKRGTEVQSFPPVEKPKEPEKPVVEVNLTLREVEILRLVANGLSNSEIAAQTESSFHTVKNILTYTMKKLHVTRRAQAVHVAAEHGFIEAKLLEKTPRVSKRKERAERKPRREYTRRNKTPYDLSQKQLEVLSHLLQGKAYWQIAAATGLSMGSAQQHIARSYEKLGVNSRDAAITKIIEENILPAELVTEQA